MSMDELMLATDIAMAIDGQPGRAVTHWPVSGEPFVVFRFYSVEHPGGRLKAGSQFRVTVEEEVPLNFGGTP